MRGIREPCVCLTAESGLRKALPKAESVYVGTSLLTRFARTWGVIPRFPEFRSELVSVRLSHGGPLRRAIRSGPTAGPAGKTFCRRPSGVNLTEEWKPAGQGRRKDRAAARERNRQRLTSGWKRRPGQPWTYGRKYSSWGAFSNSLRSSMGRVLPNSAIPVPNRFRSHCPTVAQV